MIAGRIFTFYLGVWRGKEHLIPHTIPEGWNLKGTRGRAALSLVLLTLSSDGHGFVLSGLALLAISFVLFLMALSLSLLALTF